MRPQGSCNKGLEEIVVSTNAARLSLRIGHGLWRRSKDRSKYALRVCISESRRLLPVTVDHRHHQHHQQPFHPFPRVSRYSSVPALRPSLQLLGCLSDSIPHSLLLHTHLKMARITGLTAVFLALLEITAASPTVAARQDTNTTGTCTQKAQRKAW